MYEDLFIAFARFEENQKRGEVLGEYQIFLMDERVTSNSMV